MFSAGPTKTLPKILPLGDSITYGTGSTDGGGYRSALQRLASSNGKQLNFIGSQKAGPAVTGGAPFSWANEGHPGYTIANTPVPQSGITELVPSPAFADPPDIVLLHIGVNDVNYTAGLSTMLARLSTLIAAIFTNAPNARLVVAQNTPYNFTSTEFQTYIDGIPALAATFAATGKKIYTCDMFHALNIATDLADSVHPNDSGYTKMAAVWWGAVKAFLP